MAKSKLSLAEQIAKYQEKVELLKCKKDEADRLQRKASLDRIGQALDKLDFDLSDVALLIGYMAYAAEAMQTTPGLDDQLRERGVKLLRARRGNNESSTTPQ